MNKAIIKRIKDFKAFCAWNGIPYRSAIEKAGFSYHSVIQNMRIGTISNERMTALEQSAIDLAEEKKAS